MSRSRNQPCECGSGKKSKRCCGTQAGIDAQRLDPGPVPQSAKDATDRMMAEEGYTQGKADRLFVIEQRRRRARRQRGNGWAAALAVHAMAGIR